MIPNDFDKIVVERCEKIKETLIKKGMEYTRKNERFSNFIFSQSILVPILPGLTKEKDLVCKWSKQLASVYDILNDLDEEVLPSLELWDEKIGDCINYLVILDAMMKERITQ